MFHHLMNRFTALMLALSFDDPDPRGGPRRERRDRGDVPGWVLITLMTAGLVVALWALAGEAFTSMFQDAMNKVRGAG